MKNKIYDFIEKLHIFHQESQDEYETLRILAKELSKAINSCILVVDIDGKVICNMSTNFNEKLVFQNKNNENYLESILASHVKTMVEIKFNIPLNNILSNDCDEKILFGLIPLISNMERVGTLLFYRTHEYINDEILMAKLYATFVSQTIFQKKRLVIQKTYDDINMVKSAIDILTYSELEAAIAVFKELAGTEGLIIASKIAEREGVTRSAIVNALRKLESAGLVESRSLGMKGTFIKVKNVLVLRELEKF